MKFGDSGVNVRRLQQQLNRVGAKINVDGVFGERTEKAVTKFQRSVGIVALGIAGPRTQRALDGELDPRQLSIDELRAASKRLQVSLPVLVTVAEVESAGEGFFTNGKPIILFERHIFYRRMNQQSIPVNTAEPLTNIYDSAPGGHIGGLAEYQRLNNARAFNHDIADESTSWGMFQIMGFHWQRLGYSSPSDFVTNMATSEALQLDAVTRFIESDSDMHQALREKDWPTFARLYNGPAYHRNLYDIKLARTYEQSIKSYPIRKPKAQGAAA